MRHANRYADCQSISIGDSYVYAYPDSSGHSYTYSASYGYTYSKPFVHAVTDNNTFRLE
jgi:hypothetical protein